MHVFLADDSEMVRQRLAGLLGDIPNVEVVGEAADVDQALRSIERLRPDLIVVDLHMPGNGLRLIETVGRGPHRPRILVLTNYAYEQYRRRCLQAGAEYFFDKATEFEAVIRTVTEISQSPADGSIAH